MSLKISQLNDGGAVQVNDQIPVNRGGLNFRVSVSGAGDVDGPASATDNALCRFDGTTGKLIQDSDLIVDDSGNMIGVVDITSGGTIFAPIFSVLGVTLTNPLNSLVVKNVPGNAGPFVLELINDEAASNAQVQLLFTTGSGIGLSTPVFMTAQRVNGSNGTGSLNIQCGDASISGDLFVDGTTYGLNTDLITTSIGSNNNLVITPDGTGMVQSTKEFQIVTVSPTLPVLRLTDGIFSPVVTTRPSVSALQLPSTWVEAPQMWINGETVDTQVIVGNRLAATADANTTNRICFSHASGFGACATELYSIGNSTTLADQGTMGVKCVTFTMDHTVPGYIAVNKSVGTNFFSSFKFLEAGIEKWALNNSNNSRFSITKEGMDVLRIDFTTTDVSLINNNFISPNTSTLKDVTTQSGNALNFTTNGNGDITLVPGGTGKTTTTKQIVQTISGNDSITINHDASNGLKLNKTGGTAFFSCVDFNEAGVEKWALCNNASSDFILNNSATSTVVFTVDKTSSNVTFTGNIYAANLPPETDSGDLSATLSNLNFINTTTVRFSKFIRLGNIVKFSMRVDGSVSSGDVANFPNFRINIPMLSTNFATGFEAGASCTIFGTTESSMVAGRVESITGTTQLYFETNQSITIDNNIQIEIEGYITVL